MSPTPSPLQPHPKHDLWEITPLPGMISNLTYISACEVVRDVLWDAHTTSGLPGLTTALSAFTPRLYPGPGLRS